MADPDIIVYTDMQAPVPHTYFVARTPAGVEALGEPIPAKIARTDDAAAVRARLRSVRVSEVSEDEICDALDDLIQPKTAARERAARSTAA